MNLKSERDRFFSYYKEANFLRFKQFDLERDILGIAYTLFDAEKRIKQGEKIDKLNIYLSSDTYERIDNIKLKNLLRELILLILLEDIKIKILPISKILSPKLSFTLLLVFIAFFTIFLPPLLS